MVLDARLAQALLANADGTAPWEAASHFDAQVHVRHQWPPASQPPATGKWVLMQPWEFGSLPKDWLPMLRRVDEVWAYSRSVRDCYLEAEVQGERVHVVPLGVAPDVFRPGLEPLPLATGPETRLLFVGGTIHRKGIDLLLTAFARAFRPADGVGLVIKEIIIVDTGSEDRTVDVARSFGAKVVHFDWVDDFAAARNVALAHATGDYVFWLDADDLVEPRERES